MKKVLLGIFIAIGHQITAQTWLEMMHNPESNFYDIKKEYENYIAARDNAKADNPYKRWEHFMEPRVYPSGKIIDPAIVYTEYQKYLNDQARFKTAAAGGWSLLGPTTAVPSNGGAGRLNFVRFHPSSSSTIFVGSSSGGLWKTTNGGTSWTCNTDNLGVLGVSDIAINPSNTNIMYLATGDCNMGTTYSIGVLKSINGGSSWTTTGLSFSVSQARKINRLLINPTTTTMVFAATSDGVYRSTDSGTTWTKVLNTTDLKDMEFKPGDPSVVYAVSNKNFYKSTDSGASFTNITTGLPSSTTVNRLSLAVTPADPTYVYILGSKSSDSGFSGLYRSTDSGNSFTTRSTTPNILGNYQGGTPTSGGQGWYDLSLAVSPTNKDVVICGGVNIWYSSNGGTGWSMIAHWQGMGAPYVHADIHDLQFLPGSGTTFFAACDGGIFKTTNSGSAWSDLSDGLQIGELYKIGISATDSNLVISGWQDNHSVIYWGYNIWDAVLGGDGMDCFVDWSNTNYIYGSTQYGGLYRTANQGGSWTSIVSGITETGPWTTPWMMDPNNSQTLYAGFQNVWKSTNRGTLWSKPGNLGGSGNIVWLDVCAANTQYIYAARGNGVYKSTNGGTTWTNITGSLPTASAAITSVAVNPNNKDEIWATFSGYSSANKVFTSVDGGTTWTNISGGLPNLPVNCIVIQKNLAAKGIYVGTDVGVYYRDNTTGGWISFMTGLPNVIVNDLEIFYPSNIIRAGTYGRGVWQSPLHTKVISYPSVNDYANTLHNVNIYPNPTNGSFEISFVADASMTYDVSITNSLGEEVYFTEVKNFTGSYTHDVSLNNLSDGIYFLNINNGTNKISKKMVKY